MIFVALSICYIFLYHIQCSDRYCFVYFTLIGLECRVKLILLILRLKCVLFVSILLRSDKYLTKAKHSANKVTLFYNFLLTSTKKLLGNSE